MQTNTKNAENTFIIQLGTHSTKYGFACAAEPESVLSLFYPGSDAAPKYRALKNPKAVYLQEKDWSSVDSLLAEKIGYPSKLAEPTKPVEETKPAASAGTPLLDFPIYFNGQNPVSDEKAEMWFGEEAKKHAFLQGAFPFSLFVYGRLFVPGLSVTDQTLLLERFLKWVLANGTKLNPVEKLILIVNSGWTRTETDLLLSLALTKLPVSAATVQLESMAVLCALQLSSACLVNLGESCVSVACLRDGFELPFSALVLPFGSDVQNACLHRIMLCTETDTSLAAQTLYFSAEELGTASLQQRIVQRHFLAEAVKENHSASNKTDHSIFRLYRLRKDSVAHVALPRLRSLLSSCFQERSFLAKVVALTTGNSSKDLDAFWERLEEHRFGKFEVKESKLETNKSLEKNKSKGRRKRITVETHCSEMKRFEPQKLPLLSLEEGIARSILSNKDEREVAFYAKQIIVIGGASKTKRVSFGLEKAVSKLLKEKCPDVSVQMMKINPEENVEALAWFGMQKAAYTDSLQECFIFNKEPLTRELVRKRLPFDFENMARINRVLAN